VVPKNDLDNARQLFPEAWTLIDPLPSDDIVSPGVLLPRF